jgi:predicted SnoaL-like aldol condensation-catalyzing enzyme
MSTESNKQLVQDFFHRAVNGNDPTLGESLFHAEYVDHHPIPGQPQGAAAGRFIVQHIAEISHGRPNTVVEHVFAEGDMVAARWTSGPLEVLLHVRVRDGKIAERWASFNRPRGAS